MERASQSNQTNRILAAKSVSLIVSKSKVKIKKVTYHTTRKPSNYDRKIKANPDKREILKKPYIIYESGINITPKGLVDAEYPSRDVATGKIMSTQMPFGRTKLMNLESVDSATSHHSHLSFPRRSVTSMCSRFSFKKSAVSPASMSMVSLGEAFEDDMSFAVDKEEETVGSRAPSMYRLREDPPRKDPEVKTQFKINLGETETMFLLQLPSQSDSVETDNGKVILETNDAYEKSQEKSKALTHIAVQTNTVFKKHRKLLKGRNDRRNTGAFASVWDIYDTYESLGLPGIEQGPVLNTRQEGRVDKIAVISEQKEYDSTFEFCGQTFSTRFINALMIVERIILCREHADSQLLYQGLLVQDPFKAEIEYKYALTHLWTFYSNDVKKRCVTSISWNHKNKNVVAVGYGKFKFTSKCDGLVCIWNVKCPSVPERKYSFPGDPVTFVSFSNVRWHILAVTFYSGTVLLIDIVSRYLAVKASNIHYPRYFPVHQARWFPREYKTSILVTCGKGGRVFRYKKSEFFYSNKIMALGRPHGVIQGIEQQRKCYSRKVLACKQPPAEVLIRHPVDPQMYLVGSGQGCVYVCSVQHRHDYKDLFFAHHGPIYNIEFNPFCPHIFLTCGADCCIRIWAESIYQPLITLESGTNPVQDAHWSPLHSTVIVSITGNNVEMWDIRRRVSKPMSTTQTPSKSYNNRLRFSENKFNLCVGDVDGNVHVMGMAQMPFSPSYQENVLIDAIYAALITRPDVINTLRKLGPPFVRKGHLDDKRAKLIRKLNRLHEDIS